MSRVSLNENYDGFTKIGFWKGLGGKGKKGEFLKAGLFGRKVTLFKDTAHEIKLNRGSVIEFLKANGYAEEMKSKENRKSGKVQEFFNKYITRVKSENQEMENEINKLNRLKEEIANTRENFKYNVTCSREDQINNLENLLAKLDISSEINIQSDGSVSNAEDPEKKTLAKISYYNDQYSLIMPFNNLNINQIKVNGKIITQNNQVTLKSGENEVILSKDPYLAYKFHLPDLKEVGQKKS